MNVLRSYLHAFFPPVALSPAPPLTPNSLFLSLPLLSPFPFPSSPPTPHSHNQILECVAVNLTLVYALLAYSGIKKKDFSNVYVHTEAHHDTTSP